MWYNGGMKNWLRNLKDFTIVVLLALVVLLLFIWLGYTIILLKNDPSLANAYIAVGTLILALVTALLVFVTYLSVKSGYDRENRDREERLLNEIIEWAVNLMKCSFETGFEIIPGLSDEKQWKLSRINWAFRYQAIDAKSEYVKNVASAFKGELTLQANLEKVTEKLKEIIKLLWEYARAKNGEEKSMAEKVNEGENSLWEITNKLIEEATKVKTRTMG